MTVEATTTPWDGQLFLDGRWRPGATGRLLPSIEKATGRQLAAQALGTAEDVDTAGAWSSFHYQGQTRITASRHLVLRGVADRYVEALAACARAITVGDPYAGQVGLGPTISEEQRDRAMRLVAESTRAGATVVEGGTHDGLFMRPTVLTGVTPVMPVYAEEVFAPVAPVVVADSEAQAQGAPVAYPY